MAVTAIIPTGLWSAPAFTSLTGGAQYLYLLMWTQKNRTFDCTIELTPRRWSRLSASTMQGDIDTWLDELVAADWVDADLDNQVAFIRPPETRVEPPAQYDRGDLAVSTARRRPNPATFAAVRREVFARDNYTCQMCELKSEDVPLGYDGWLNVWARRPDRRWSELHLDHITPYSLGGEFSVVNLRTACRPCNRERGANV